MKIVLPSDTAHTIDLIPRFYPVDAVDLYLKNEATKVEAIVSSTYSIDGGVMLLNFTKDFNDGDKYQIKVTENDTVVFRGKLLATAQTPQEYKLTEGKYYYE